MKKFYKGLILLFVVTFSSLSIGFGLVITSTQTILTLENESLETKATRMPIDAWIIISGSREDYDKQEIIDNGCNKTYEILRDIGYSSSQIYYLGPPAAAPGPTSSYQNATATLANIQYAIETWAAGRVSSSEALGIYMFDHGGTGSFSLKGTNLADTNLNTYLDNFESTTNCDRILIIYEACHSGSFINPVSKDNRIVVTATDINHNSHVNGDWTWAAFSETFWSSLKSCKTIGQAFEDAEEAVHDLGYGDTQFPLIDDDHNEVGHEVDASGNLPNGGDGNDALNTRITYLLTCIPLIIIRYWPIRKFFDPSVQIIPYWVVIENKSIVEKVYLRFLPPDWRPPTPQPDPDDGTPLVGDPNLYILELSDPDGDGNFTGDVSGSVLGKYQGDWTVNVLARTTSGDFADVESSAITINQGGTPPQDTTDPTVQITNPLAGETVTGLINITAEGDDDQALEKMQLFIDDVLVKELIMPDYYPYEISYEWNTTQNGTGAHTITAKAIDKAGNSATQTIRVNAQEIPGFGFAIIIMGCFLVVITIQVLKRRKILDYVI